MRQIAAHSLALLLAVTAAPGLTSPALAQGRPPTSGVPSGPGGANPAVFRSPPLDPVSLIMAYHRLTGTTLDFRPYAEASTAYRNATTFDRADVLAREIARLEGTFSSLDLNRVYLMRIGSRLRQYDAARSGYPIALDPESYIGMQDPVTFRAFGLQFRNLDEVALVPVGDAAAARLFAQRHSLSMQSETAGDVALEFAIRLAEAPPAISTGITIVRADIVAARVITRSGQPVWDFGQTAAGRAPATPGAAPGTVAALKAADIQGIRVGMPPAEASGIASRAYPVASPRGDAGGRWFRGADLRGPTLPRCGQDPLPAADLAYRMGMTALTGGDINAPPPVSDESEACLGFDIGTAASRTGNVSRVTSGQRLAGATPEAVRQALVEKYGPPTYTRQEGRTLQWIGRDPARTDGGLVAITARIEPRQGGGILLAVDVLDYVDPSPRQAPTPAAAPSAPRL